ncbi:MAG: YdcF family protein [Phenylobacterium sp.]|uniref:YdcF family protein n=1 Tax=Phenylobacterium sp. TaxID=1871053 RepID=UPI001A627CDE|nr:YdcF family protein [Phenylobacterium sp.]MBL8556426.1 YdcF family protein [Phenylobacterium sp.]
MSAPPLIAIFGAAIRPDGTPSEALLRRIGYGLEAARLHPDAPILCSGGVVRPGPSEASIMAEALIKRGVAPERLILDEASLDTIQNAAAAQAEARRGGHPFVIVCSDGYHVPRIRMLLHLHGVDSRPGPFRRGPAGAPVHGWLGMSLRESLAIPHNLAVMLTRRRAPRS